MGWGVAGREVVEEENEGSLQGTERQGRGEGTGKGRGMEEVAGRGGGGEEGEGGRGGGRAKASKCCGEIWSVGCCTSAVGMNVWKVERKVESRV